MKRSYLFILTLGLSMSLQGMKQKKPPTNYKTIATLLWNKGDNQFIYNNIKKNKEITTYFLSPSKNPYGNFAIGKPTRSVLDSLEIIFKDKEYNWIYSPKDKPSTELKKQLIKEKFIDRGSYVIAKLLTKNYKQQLFPKIKKFTVKEVGTNKYGFEAWCRLAAKLFGCTHDDIKAFHTPFFQKYNNVCFFIGIKEDTAIALTLTQITDKTLYISTIGTHPEFKKENYDLALAQCCIENLKELVDSVIVVAPQPTYKKYKNIGFKPVKLFSALRRIRKQELSKT